MTLASPPLPSSSNDDTPDDDDDDILSVMDLVTTTTTTTPPCGHALLLLEDPSCRHTLSTPPTPPPSPLYHHHVTTAMVQVTTARDHHHPPPTPPPRPDSTTSLTYSISPPPSRSGDVPPVSPLTFTTAFTLCTPGNSSSSSRPEVPPMTTTTTANDRHGGHHHHHHPHYYSSSNDMMDRTISVSSQSTTDTFPPAAATIPTIHGSTCHSSVVAAASAAVPQDYRILQTFRRQSLLHRHHHRQSHSWLGTKWLSDCLHDMNIDLHYIMSTQSLKNSREKEQHKDPVVQWETYMDHHHAPLGDTKKRPIFSVSLMIACTVLLLVSFQMNQWTMESFRDNSSLGPSSDTLVRMGALSSTKLLFAAKNDVDDDAAVTTPIVEWYRILTTIGIHGGILHWLCSMMAILHVGVPMERRYGTVWMGGTFVLSSIAANIGTLIYSPFDYILSPMGGICSWYGLRCSFIGTHYGTLCQLYLNEPPPSTAATTKSGNSMFLSRTMTKTPQPFPFRATQLVLFLEMALFFVIGLLPWINQFTNCCGLLYGLIIGLYVFQPSGSTYKYIQLYCQAAYLSVGTMAIESKSSVLRTIGGIMYHLNLPIRRRIIPGILLCTIIGFSTSNIFYLYYSTGTGDLPCRSCHYVDCLPWPDTIYQQCEPCNYIKIQYVTIEESTDGDADADADPDNQGINAIVISSNGDIANELEADETVPSGFHVGTNYFIEMICPYGESTFFVIPNQLPQNRKEWLQSCHDYCEL